jgi:Reverse transcriptase (RNA-dependent DNA polymerase)/Endonuclease-reverse transcriptase
MNHHILNINVNGIVTLLPEIHNLLSTYKPIVVILTDTRHKQRPWFNFLGYTLYHAPTPDIVGGVIVLVRSDIPSRPAPSPFNSYPPYWYSTSVEINIGTPYTITGVYRRPNSILYPFTHHIQPFIRRKSHFIIGDLNAKHQLWGNKTKNVIGTWLSQQSISIVIPPTHTFAINNRYSTIDVLLTHRPELFTDTITLDSLSTSDHLPVLYTFTSRLHPTDNKHLHYNYTLADWKAYQHLVHDTLTTPKLLTSIDEIDSAITHLTTTIQNSAKQAIPTYTPKPPFLRKLPKHILHLIRLRHKTLNAYQNTKNPSLKPILNSLTHQIKNLRKKWLSSLWQSKLVEAHSDPHKFWTIVRSAHSKYQRCGITKDNHIASPQEQATILTNNINTGTPYQNTIENTAEAPQIPPKTLRHFLKAMKGKKSAGPDGIQAILLQKLPRKGFAHLLQIYQACFRLNHFPTRWQTAIITPLLKPHKDPTLPSSYRPISLLDHMGKLLEKLIRHYLIQHIDDHNTLPHTQAGFRSKHSTTMQLCRVASHVHSALTNRHATCMISIDCTDAFGSVSHPKLLHELTRHSTPAWITNIITSFLHSRKASFRVSKYTAPPVSIHQGVPQGAVLSPTLFNIYTADILTSIDPQVEVAAYADDIALYSSHRNPYIAVNKIEDIITHLSHKLNEYNIQINPNKTDGLIFSYHSPYKKPTHFQINNQWRVFSNQITYLGITLDSHLTYSKHLTNKLTQMRHKVKQLYRLLYSPHITIRLKLLIFKMVIRPSLLYGAPLFRELYTSILIKIQQFENRLIKTIAFGTSLQLHRTRDIRRHWNINTTKDYITQRYIKFYNSLPSSGSPLFSVIQPPTRTTWHNSRIIDITNTETEHLHR